MNTISLATSSSRARWDGSMVLFDLTVDGEDVLCAVSRAALEQLGTSRCFKKEDALACFNRQRALLEALAERKLRSRESGPCGRLTLWADDVETPLPPDGSVAVQQRSA